MDDQTLLASILSALPELALAAGPQWPDIQQKLNKILEDTNWDDPAEMQKGVDAILILFDGTPGGKPIINEILRQQKPALGGERGLDGSSSPTGLSTNIQALVAHGSRSVAALSEPNRSAEDLAHLSGARSLEAGSAPDAIPADCAVYAPPKAAPGDQILIQVFVFPPEEEEKVEKQAKQADEDAEQRALQTLAIDLSPGARLDIRLEMPGLAIDEPDAFLTWRGRANAAQFFADVPSDLTPQKLVGTVRVAAAGVPIGTLRFRLEIIQAGQATVAAPKAAPAETTANRYRKVFLSYSSKDRAEVLRRAQSLRLVGIDFFQDVLDLEPGQRWEKELYRNIDDCDAFFLFWSSHSAASEWVAREIEYAVKRKAGGHDHPPAIVPIPVEVPVPRPPQILEHLHFNDALLAHIHLADQQ